MHSFIHEITNSSKTTCIILAAGQNKTRGQKCPKSLVDMGGNKRLIDVQIDTVKKTFKNVEIFCSVGDQSKSVINYIIDNYPDVRIVENLKYNQTTPLESLKLCLNCATISDTCIIYGDKFFDQDSITFEDFDSPTIVESTGDDFSKTDLGLVYQNNKLKNISYGVKNKWGQIFFIPRGLFNNFRKKINNLSKRYYNIFDLINNLAKEYSFKIHKSKTIEEV
tara:strand:- start:3061 stop:3726 length:666 start_codon:yes stop_codon:yes gene_type:complete